MFAFSRPKNHHLRLAIINVFHNWLFQLYLSSLFITYVLRGFPLYEMSLLGNVEELNIWEKYRIIMNTRLHVTSSGLCIQIIYKNQRKHGLAYDTGCDRKYTWHIPYNKLKLSDAYMRWQFNHHWYRNWLVAWSAPSHYQKQCWNFIPNRIETNEGPNTWVTL